MRPVRNNRFLGAAIVAVLVMSACGKSKPTDGGGASAPAPAITTALKYYNDFPFNQVYTAPITVGGQDVEVVTDTGSANLLVIGDSTHCPNCTNEYGYNSTYTPSAGAKELTAHWSMSFLPIGSATMLAYQDTVTFGGQSLPNHSFGLVTAEQGIPNIWGLSYASGARPFGQAQTPLFDALIGAAHLSNQFSMRLCALKNGSIMTIGGFDAAAAGGLDKVQWTAIAERDKYSISVNKMFIDLPGQSEAWLWTPATTDMIIVDSGTNPLVLPAESVAALVTLLQSVASKNGITLAADFWPTTSAHGGYASLSDEAIAGFPMISLNLPDYSHEGQSFTLSIAPSTYFQTRKDGKRFLGIESGDSIVILGTVFMENFVTLFDRGNLDNAWHDASARVGFFPISSLCGA